MKVMTGDTIGPMFSLRHQVKGGGYLQGGGGGRRDRQGVHPAWSEFSQATNRAGIPAVSGDPTRNLTTDMLWAVYWRTPDVRAAVDSITRQIATADWSVVPLPGSVDVEDEKELTEAMAAGQAVARWLQAPMQGKVWQSVATMFIQDLLVYDAGVLEKNMAGDTLKKIVPRRGDDFWPIITKTGVVTGWEQRVNAQTVRFDLDQLVVVHLFPNTNTPRGMPLIETIVNEVVSIIRASERTMITLDASEIPPGLLYLTGISGKSSEDVLQEFVANKGRDDRMRVLSFPDAAAGKAEWIPLNHSPKEIQMAELIDQIRRTIWRIFGVFPVSMGATDGMPRATAEVQLDASASHLIRPILELLQEVFTLQILPHLLEDKWKGRLGFRFDFTRDFSPEEEKSQAEADRILIQEGLATRNQIRARRGWVPYGPEGDVITVVSAPVRLDDAVKVEGPDPSSEPSPGEDSPDDPPDDDGGPGEVEGGDDGEVPEGEEGPGASASRPLRAHRHGPGCEHRAPGEPSDLPSEWQDEARFKGYRALSLQSLGYTVSRYDRTVRPIWGEGRDEFLSLLQAAYQDDRISPEEAATLTTELSRVLDRTVGRWDAETGDQYREAAQVGLTFAEKETGAPPVRSAEDFATPYRQRAMAYLSGDGGPIQDVKLRVISILGAVARSRILSGLARGSGFTAPSEIVPGVDLEILLLAVQDAWNANEHRIANWSGKLVELSNQASQEAFLSAATSKEGGATEWYVEWVNAGGSCPTCSTLGASGFMVARNLPTVPGGATECRGHCRCVLVYWTREEVQAGSAVFLGAGNTGEDL